MKDRSKSVVEGGLNAGGVYVFIQASIALTAKFFPDLPWPEIETFVGSVAALFLGGGFALWADRRRYNGTEPTD